LICSTRTGSKFVIMSLPSLAFAACNFSLSVQGRLVPSSTGQGHMSMSPENSPLVPLSGQTSYENASCTPPSHEPLDVGHATPV